MAVQAQTETDVCQEDSALCEAVYDWTGNEFLAEAARWLIGNPLQIAVIVAVSYAINRMVRRAIRRLSVRLGAAAADTGLLSNATNERAERRAASISTLLRSTSSAVIYSVALIMCLEIVGISIAPILASAGVAGLAIGFGAQRLVEDIITGLFMLLEDQFGVGDRIDVDLVDGTVESLSLRSTMIRDPNGTLWHVPNSEIRRVANESQLWSRAVVDVGVAYGTGIPQAMATLDEAARNLSEDSAWADDVIREPEVLGIQALGADAVNLRVITRIRPKARRQFERELRAALIDALDSAEVEMPNRQFDVWMRN